jgi:hypothetical protein
MNPAIIEITHGSKHVADLGFAPAEAKKLKLRAKPNSGFERPSARYFFSLTNLRSSLK